MRLTLPTVVLAFAAFAAPALAQSLDTPGAATRPADQMTVKATVATTVATGPEGREPTPLAVQGLAAETAPLPSQPDPLTPPAPDASPVQAPGAPGPTAASPASDAPRDPIVIALRERLAARKEPIDAAARADAVTLRAFYEVRPAPLWTDTSGLSPRGAAVLRAIADAARHGLDPNLGLTPPVPPASGASSDTLADLEIDIGLAALRYARHARGGRIDPPSLSKMIDLRPRLFEPRTVLEALATASDAAAYLEGLHPRHSGFFALRDALAKVRAEPTAAANADIERRIVVNLERWRWLPDDLGAFHVWDNVPEQLTRVIHDGKVTLEERIVVGKPNTPTPMFSAPMRYVIFHPTWGVPEGIKTNELGPQLRRAQASASSGWFFSENEGASRVMRRHDLRVFHGGREVNPDRINWSSVDVRQFQFTQPASARNVLGLVKFRFPNRFDVYMHDTSERHLFTRGQRAFSHGCMRVENPLRLAETILAYDKGWSRERIAAVVAKGSTTDVTLERPVPVHIVYFTATVDAAGRLLSHGDLYGQDSRVASALAGRTVALATVKSEVGKSDAASERRGDASRRETQAPRKPVRQAKAKASGSSGQTSDFNPFSSLSAN